MRNFYVVLAIFVSLGVLSKEPSRNIYNGNSAENPYNLFKKNNLESDEIFITDIAHGDLDKISTDEIEFFLEIDRYFGKTNGNNQLLYPGEIGLGDTVPLTLRVKQSKISDEFFYLENKLLFNNESIDIYNKLNNMDSLWRTLHIDIPVTFIKFPSQPGESVFNSIKITLDASLTNKESPIEIDWAAL